jgi:hypothetical protein
LVLIIQIIVLFEGGDERKIQILFEGVDGRKIQDLFVSIILGEGFYFFFLNIDS